MNKKNEKKQVETKGTKKETQTKEGKCKDICNCSLAWGI